MFNCIIFFYSILFLWEHDGHGDVTQWGLVKEDDFSGPRVAGGQCVVCPGGGSRAQRTQLTSAIEILLYKMGRVFQMLSYLLSLCANSVAYYAGSVGGSCRRERRRLPSDLQDTGCLATVDLHILGRERGPWAVHTVNKNRRVQQKLNRFCVLNPK